MKECGGCKRKIADYSVFCPYCGYKMDAQSTVVEEQPVVTEFSGSEKRPVDVTAEKSISAVVQADTVVQMTPTKPRKKVGVLAIAIAIVVVLAVAAVVLVPAGRDKERQTTMMMAEEALKNEDYEQAIRLYDKEANRESEDQSAAIRGRENAATAYREEVLAQVRVYVIEGQFREAIELLRNSLTVLPDDSVLMAEIEAVQQAEEESYLQEMIDTAMVYARNGDFPGSLAELDKYIEQYGAVEQLLTARRNCLTAYQAYVVEESLCRARSGNYTSALALAEQGLNYFNSAKVTELTLIYRSYIPVLLSDMEIFLNESHGGSWNAPTDMTNNYLSDNYGNQYTSSLTVSHGSVTYLLRGQYNTFSGTVACPKLNISAGRDSATLYVYGDGKLLKTFSEFSPASSPESFTISVSGVERLQLSWDCAGYNVWENWGDYATIFDGAFFPTPLALPAE